MMTTAAFFVPHVAPRPQWQLPAPDTWRCEQGEVGDCESNGPSASLAVEGWAEEMRPPAIIWYSVATYLTTWVVPEDWESLQQTPEAIRTALETLEALLPPAHRQSAGQVAWMLLTIVGHAACGAAAVSGESPGERGGPGATRMLRGSGSTARHHGPKAPSATQHCWFCMPTPPRGNVWRYKDL